jgi:hypothetical protein
MSSAIATARFEDGLELFARLRVSKISHVSKRIVLTGPRNHRRETTVHSSSNGKQESVRDARVFRVRDDKLGDITTNSNCVSDHDKYPSYLKSVREPSEYQDHDNRKYVQRNGQ